MRNCNKTGIVVLLIAAACTTRNAALSVHLADYSAHPISERLRVDMPSGEAPLYAELRSVLDVQDFRSASLAEDAFGRPLLRLCFAPHGRDKFSALARQNLQRRLVFLLEGKLLFAPVIQSASAPDCLEISGAVTAQHAAALQRILR
jgi:preprotein translocase subunit SecD